MFKVIFAYAIELRLNYFSIITVICDISKQTEQRARIAKIFAPWHLSIAMSSIWYILMYLYIMFSIVYTYLFNYSCRFA